MEALEERLQLSSANFVDGHLSIEVTGSDRVQVSASQGQAVVKFNGRTADIGSVVAAQVTEIVVTANADLSGDNVIDLSQITRSRFPSLTGTTVFGAAGDDTIRGSAFADQLDGGAGNDRLIGHRGGDVLTGGEDNDRLSGGYGNDTLDGGNGSDRLNAGTGANMIYCDETADRVFGESHRDTTLPEQSNHSTGPAEADFAALTMPPMPPITPMLSLSTVGGSEATRILNVGVTLTSAIPSAITAYFSSSSGSAISGVDFTPTSGSFVIPANTLTTTISLLNFIVNDTLAEGLESFLFTLTSAIGAMVNNAPSMAMIMDDDGGGGGGGPPPPPPPPPPNTNPTIGNIANQTTNEDTSLGPINFTVGDLETPAGNLAMSVDPMTNMMLFPLGSITFGGSGANRTVTLNPALNANGTGNVWLKVTDANGGFALRNFQVTVNSINDAPVVTAITNRTNNEGDDGTSTPSTAINVMASDVDHATSQLTFAATNLPPGLTINSTSGLISGKINYSAAADTNYNVTITVTDPLLATGTATFTWTVRNAAIGSLTGKERNSGSAMPNSITVNGMTTDVIYVVPGNSIQLAVAAAIGAVLPKTSDIIFFAPNALAPFTGTFATTPVLMLPFSGNVTITVGLDTNLDGFLTMLDPGAEPTHQFVVKMINFTGGKIEARRTIPVDLQEAFFEVNAGEIFDTASTFEARLVGGVQGAASMIRGVIVDGTTVVTQLNPVLGTSGTWMPSGSTDLATIRFFADANNSGAPDPGEPWIASNVFTVAPLNTVARTYDVSTLLTATAHPLFGKSLAFIDGEVQSKVAAGNKIIRVKDAATDFRAAATIALTGVGFFTPGFFSPDPVTGVFAATSHFDFSIPDNRIRYVYSYSGGTGVTSGDESIIEWLGNTTTLAHEIGHQLLGIPLVGSGHHASITNLMHGEPYGDAVDGTSVQLELGQARTYSGL